MSKRYPQGAGSKYLHRMAWEEVHGPIPDGMVIDHINGDTHDNRIENLRCISQSHNVLNRADTKGYTWAAHANKWRAYIQVDGKRYNLGYFASESDAQSAREAKYKELMGEDFNGRI